MSMQEIENLTDEELVEQLKLQGFEPGPIVETTRRVYQRKLFDLLNGDTEGAAGDRYEDQYSDQDSQEDEEPIPEPVRERPKSASPRKRPVQGSPRRSARHRQVDASSKEQEESEPAPVEHPPATNTAQKKGLSIWLQLGIFLVIAVLVFLVLQNMEPGSKSSVPKVSGSK